MEERRFQSGDAVIEEGGPGDFFYVTGSGELEVAHVLLTCFGAILKLVNVVRRFVLSPHASHPEVDSSLSLYEEGRHQRESVRCVAEMARKFELQV